MLKKQKTKRTDEWEYFDDCAVCQAMKEGKDRTMEELTEAFRKQNEKNRQKGDA